MAMVTNRIRSPNTALRKGKLDHQRAQSGRGQADKLYRLGDMVNKEAAVDCDPERAPAGLNIARD
jgi:hypothetical protein